MPRHPRIHAPGLLYHLMARGNNGQAVFLTSADYEAFLQALQTTRAHYPFSLYAYVLMPNHFHLLLEVRETATGRLMQALLTGYARRFNRVHQRRGHVFQGRYKAIVCERDSYLLELVRYIHLNPVRAGLVKRPRDWLWSGHREYLGTAKRGLVNPGPAQGQLATPAQYEAFVREGVKRGYRAEWHPSDSAPFLGTEKFVKRVAKRREPASVRRPPPLEVLWQEAVEQAGLSPEALRHGGRSAWVVKARDGFIRRAVLEAGYRAATVAAFVGCHASNVSRALQRGVVSR
ncbi:MAG TPA: transposase [Candidatus Binatia bacterium]|jgi:REP element-mobilizing transposase RayT|nr:transposase [Candidatus Binatia bacterium]